MKKILKVHFQRIFSLFALCVLCVTMFLGGQMTAPAVYAAGSSNAFDDSYVMEDLEGMTIDGKVFNVADYAPSAEKETTVLLFAEYCYSPYTSEQGNYALYVYVWNPQQIVYNVRSTRNSIQFSYGGDTATASKYSLLFLSGSKEQGAENLFYKFKVELSVDSRSSILVALDGESRVYDISGIELVTASDEDIHDYKVGAVYTYSGFAEGYGDTDAPPLSFTKKEGETFVIDDGIQQTFYRAGKTNGRTSYSQDTLHSVYFSIPNTVLEAYGALSAVKMEWLKTQTSWGLLTGTERFYDAFIDIVGLSAASSTPSYPSVALPFTEYGFKTSTYDPNGQFTFNFGMDGYERIESLAYVFSTPSFGVDIADDYVVPWEDIYAWMQAYYDEYGDSREYDTTPEDGGEPGWLYAKYTFTPYKHDYLEVDGVTYPFSEALFSYVAPEKTVMDIKATDNRSLTSVDIDYSWWDWITGGSGTVTSKNEFNGKGIDAIKIVEEADIKAPARETCDHLYIDINDYNSFIDYYDAAVAKEETVVLIRFDVGEYNALEVAQGVPFDADIVEGVIDYDTNARIFNLSVYLDLDVISLTFDNGETEVTLSVVADPIDVGSDGTPALDTTSDKAPWWVYVIIVLLELLVLLLLHFVLKKIFGLSGKPFYIVWFILLAVVIVINVIFITAWAQAIFQWLRSWLPFV